MERHTPAFASSIRWQSANVISQVCLQLLFIMVLARLISKADFGVMSIALVVVGFVEIFAQIGIGPSLVQRKDLQIRHVRAAMYFSIGLGLAFFALMYCAAPQIGIWFKSDALVNVLRWVALSSVVWSTNMTQGSLFSGSVVQFHWSVAGSKQKDSHREGERGPNRPMGRAYGEPAT